MGTVQSRYEMRRTDGTDYWSVYDIFTRKTVVLEGVAMDRLTIEEADDLIDLLNRRDDIEREARSE